MESSSGPLGLVQIDDRALQCSHENSLGREDMHLQRLIIPIIAVALGIAFASTGETQRPPKMQAPVAFGVALSDRSLDFIKGATVTQLGGNSYLNVLPREAVPKANELPAPYPRINLTTIIPDGVDPMNTWVVMSRNYVPIVTDGPICQAQPRLFWSSTDISLYSHRIATEFLLMTRALVERNCAPGVVKTIRIAITTTKRDDPFGTGPGRIWYEGDVLVDRGYQLVHLDQEKFLTYMGQRAAAQNAMAAKAARDRQASTISGYCELYPTVCGVVLGGAALSTLSGAGQSGGSGAGPDYPQICYDSCMLNTGGDVLACSAMCGHP